MDEEDQLIQVSPRHAVRVGAEYGNYSVPIVNFVTKGRGWLPVIDLYWRI